MARAANDSFKLDNRKFSICTFNAAVLKKQKKKKKKGRKFRKSAGFATNGVVGLRMKFTFKALHRLSGNGGRTLFNLFI